jgi:3D (Asp-Asp-Asp) domain-containing protein
MSANGNAGHSTFAFRVRQEGVGSRRTVWSGISSVLLLTMASMSMGCASIRPPRNVEPVFRRMEVTAYCACGKCCGWRRTWYGRPVNADGPNRGRPKQVGMTASGAKARNGTIAADTTRYPFGTIMHIEGYGYGRVEDRGGAIKGDHIDLFFPSHIEALLWGRRRLPVRIWFMPSLRGELIGLKSLMAALEETPDNGHADSDQSQSVRPLCETP